MSNEHEECAGKPLGPSVADTANTDRSQGGVRYGGGRRGSLPALPRMSVFQAQTETDRGWGLRSVGHRTSEDKEMRVDAKRSANTKCAEVISTHPGNEAYINGYRGGWHLATLKTY